MKSTLAFLLCCGAPLPPNSRPLLLHKFEWGILATTLIAVLSVRLIQEGKKKWKEHVSKRDAA